MTGDGPDKNVTGASASACLVAEVIGNGDTLEHAIDNAITPLLRQRIPIRGVDVIGWKMSGTPKDTPMGYAWTDIKYRVILKVAYDGTL